MGRGLATAESRFPMFAGAALKGRTLVRPLTIFWGFIRGRARVKPEYGSATVGKKSN
jgi:hypothetical protein